MQRSFRPWVVSRVALQLPSRPSAYCRRFFIARYLASRPFRRILPRLQFRHDDAFMITAITAVGLSRATPALSGLPGAKQNRAIHRARQGKARY